MSATCEKPLSERLRSWKGVVAEKTYNARQEADWGCGFIIFPIANGPRVDLKTQSGLFLM